MTRDRLDLKVIHFVKLFRQSWPGFGITSPVIMDVILPCLNEAAALPWVLGKMPVGFHLMVVGNGSADGSGDIARSLGATVAPEPARGFGAAAHASLLQARLANWELARRVPYYDMKLAEEAPKRRCALKQKIIAMPSTST